MTKRETTGPASAHVKQRLNLVVIRGPEWGARAGSSVDLGVVAGGSWIQRLAAAVRIRLWNAQVRRLLYRKGV